ncbi:endocuticle structural glycoprotein SgAbd-1-like [Cimex lectularius]|uniref:CPR type cuticle protein n=1 Tax=Cimex lectularius TaxID=79782 RepID=A0A8I6TDI8_CIMLE|nr:endocuticle structural glycoprotein SgAbd-1-like [Cimex lectularius]
MKQQFSLLLVLLSWKLAHGENDTSLTDLKAEEHHIQESPMPLPLPFGFRRPNRLQQIGGKPHPFPSPPHPPAPQEQEESTTEGCVFQTTPSDLSTDAVPVTEEPTTRRPRPTKKRPPPTPPTPQSEEEEEGDGLVYSISRMDEDGGYFFDFLASNSVFRQEQGFFKTNPDPKGEKIHVKTGAYGFTSPEGARVRIDYVADENGFRAFDTT